MGEWGQSEEGFKKEDHNSGGKENSRKTLGSTSSRIGTEGGKKVTKKSQKGKP